MALKLITSPNRLKYTCNAAAAAAAKLLSSWKKVEVYTTLSIGGAVAKKGRQKRPEKIAVKVGHTSRSRVLFRKKSAHYTIRLALRGI